MPNLSNYINGEWQAGSGAELVTINPATGHPSWSSNQSTSSDVQRAALAARDAFESWAASTSEERIAVCLRFRDLLKENAESLSAIISEEVGKPLWESRTEVATMAGKIDVSILAYQQRTGESANTVADGQAVLRHLPHGVFGVFGPYNFPGHLPNGHIVPALIAGNTIVFKPSEYAPRSAIKTVQLWEQAGLLKGVLNLINGGRDTGVALSQNALLDGVLFTGSSLTGIALHRQFGGHPNKMLALEMGGNNALVVWDIKDIDEDINAAVHHTIFSAFVSAGQRCTCARRLIIQDSPQAQKFIDRLIEVAARISIGAPDSLPAPFMGPVVSSAVAARLLQAQQDMLAKGGKSLLPMKQLDPSTGFVTAGIVDVTDAKGIPDEEWFGPLLQVIRVANFDAAMKIANATEFGLSAALLSDDASLWQRFKMQARAGIVNWNRPTTGAAGTAPFGGIGKSGNHRPSAFYAADYCAYPVASVENSVLEMPVKLSPGLHF